MEQPQETTLLALPFRKTKWRFLALILGALILFGNNYSFDNPQALQSQIELELDISISQFNLMYSVFSLPNIFLTLIGGIIIDKLGVRFGIFTFTLVVTFAQIIIAVGGTLKLYYLMLIGRAIFGIASENLIISQSTFVSLWFRGKELATAMGIIMTVPEIGSALNSFLSPMIYQNTQSLSVPLFTSVGFCLFSFACAIALVILDKFADKMDAQAKQLAFLASEDEEEEPEIKEELSFKDIKKLSGTFWILLLICTLCLCIYIPFLDNVNEFCQFRFNYTPVLAGRAIVVTYLTPTIISPFVGVLIDRTGMRRRWMLLTTSLFILTHLLFATIPTPIDGSPQYAGMIPLVFLGVSFSFYSCVIIPSIQYVVDQRIMGTAFGLLGVLESVGQCIFPLVAASIYNTYENYQQVALFYMGIGCLALLFAISLYFVDKKGSAILDSLNPTEAMAKLMDKTDEFTNPSDTTDEEDLELTETFSPQKEEKVNEDHKERILNFKSGISETPVFTINR